MSSRFESCLAFTWRPENDGQQLHITPGDPGGATSWGVTIATYSAWCAKQGMPTPSVADLAAASKSELSQLIESEFWQPIYGDQLPAGVDLMVFDFGFTAGVGNGIRRLQEALGVVIDGQLGPKTLAAVTAADPTSLIGELKARQLAYYQSLSTYAEFGHGWTNRTNARAAAALVMAAGAGGMAPTSAAPPTAANGNTFINEVRHALGV